MSLLLQATPIAQFYTLINKAQAEASLYLKEELEAYLVFLLMRFCQKPELAKQVLGLAFLEAYQKASRDSTNLKEIADSCLIFAGLFPGYAQKRRVSVRYFIDLGQSAYAQAAHYTRPTEANLYQDLSNEFIKLSTVLHATRETHTLPELNSWFERLGHGATVN
jgi:hypothetical protein